MERDPGDPEEDGAGDQLIDVGRAAAEVDHLFILCSVDAPEAATLIEHGFVEGWANTHPGQGTACRRFFFDNLYLELLWVDDAEQAQSPPARRTGVWDRWLNRAHGASPFGVVLRPAAEAIVAAPPFATWAYRPSYLPLGAAIGVADDAPITEPAFFWTGFRAEPARKSLGGTVHAAGQRVTRVTFGVPEPGAWSVPARASAALGLVEFTPSDQHLLELELDGGRAGQSIDLRGELPLVFRW